MVKGVGCFFFLFDIFVWFVFVLCDVVVVDVYVLCFCRDVSVVEGIGDYV